MKVQPRDVSDWVEPEVTERRLARQWASIDGRRPVRGVAGVRVLRLSLIVAPLLCAALYFVWTQRDVGPGNYGVIESSATPLTVQLRDGSSVELAAQTRLRVLQDQAAAVQLEIGEGRADFDVKHVEGRTFDVRAGVVSVRVVGTSFQVMKATRADGTQVEVAVKRGVVEVRRRDRGGEVRRLSAGETWSAWVGAVPAPAPTAAAAAEPVTPDTVAIEPMPAPVPGGAAVKVARGVVSITDAHASITDAAVSSAAVSGSSEMPASSTRAQRHAQSLDARGVQPRMSAANAHGLFARASVARRAGRMQEAADAFAELLKRFPRDSRAGVAAFELGRIRMDVLSDAKGATQAFGEALRLARKASYREDALARLVIAHDALGEHEACARARANYLAQYPAGVHLTAVGLLCGTNAHR